VKALQWREGRGVRCVLEQRKDQSQLVCSVIGHKNMSILVLNCVFVKGVNFDQCVMCDGCWDAVHVV
jgi:hypothetical protein